MSQSEVGPTDLSILELELGETGAIDPPFMKQSVAVSPTKQQIVEISPTNPAMWNTVKIWPTDSEMKKTDGVASTDSAMLNIDKVCPTDSAMKKTDRAGTTDASVIVDGTDLAYPLLQQIDGISQTDSAMKRTDGARSTDACVKVDETDLAYPLLQPVVEIGPRNPSMQNIDIICPADFSMHKTNEASLTHPSEKDVATDHADPVSDPQKVDESGPFDPSKPKVDSNGPADSIQRVDETGPPITTGNSTPVTGLAPPGSTTKPLTPDYSTPVPPFAGLAIAALSAAVQCSGGEKFRNLLNNVDPAMVAVAAEAPAPLAAPVAAPAAEPVASPVAAPEAAPEAAPVNAGKDGRGTRIIHSGFTGVSRFVHFVDRGEGKGTSRGAHRTVNGNKMWQK